jgi:hypothetical protein
MQGSGNCAQGAELMKVFIAIERRRIDMASLKTYEEINEKSVRGKRL